MSLTHYATKHHEGLQQVIHGLSHVRIPIRRFFKKPTFPVNRVLINRNQLPNVHILVTLYFLYYFAVQMIPEGADPAKYNILMNRRPKLCSRPGGLIN